MNYEEVCLIHKEDYLRHIQEKLELYHYTRQLAALAQNHAPHSRIHTREVFLAHRATEEVHKSSILHILAEWRYEARSTEHRPDTLHFVEELNEQFVLR